MPMKRGTRTPECWKCIGGIWWKRCPGCKQWIVSSPEFFHRYKGEKLQSRCKVCTNVPAGMRLEGKPLVIKAPRVAALTSVPHILPLAAALMALA